jgi:solute carrier family 30 (zinc transporter), member 2
VEEQLGGCVTSDEELHLRETPKKIKNINLEAAYVHILTDIILSIGVIVSALIIYFLSPDHHTWSPWQLADPLCTYLFSFLAIYSTWPILKEAVLLLLDASHGEHIPTDLAMEIAELASVKELLKLRVWSTNRAKHYAAVKVRMQKGYGG